MRKRSIIAGAAVALSLAVAGTAQADTVNGGWSYTGNYDVAINGQEARISSATASGSFGDWLFSKPADAASESNANKVFDGKFTFQALGGQVNGSHISVSPDNGQGGRMSYVRLEDNPSGVQVFFDDVQTQGFNERWIATLDRTQAHTIEFKMSLVPGENNDVVTVSVDGDKKVSGTSWENYYRHDPEAWGNGQNVPQTDRMIFQARGASTNFGPTPAADRGFLITDVSASTSASGGPVAEPLPVGPAGPQGPAGQNGTNGTTTIIYDRGALAGNTIRTIHARRIKGKTFLSLRASLRGKRLQAHGRSVKVDLRGKAVGNYRVVMVAKYKTKSTGKIHAVRSIRTLSIVRK